MKFISDGVWLFLIPGFIAIFVAGFISDFPAVHEAQLAISYVTVTTLCAAISLLAAHAVKRHRGERVELAQLVRRPWFALSLLVTSVVFGFLLGILHNTDRVSNMLQAIFGPELVTIVSHGQLRAELFGRSYGKGGANQPMWDGRPCFAHNTSSHYIRVVFRDEARVYEGVAEKWSGRKDDPDVYLSPACEVEGETVTVIRGPGTWLNLEGVRQIQVIDDICSPCALQIQREERTPEPPPCCYDNPKANRKCWSEKEYCAFHSSGQEPGPELAGSGKIVNPVHRRRSARENR